MMQRNQNASVEFMIDERIVCVGRVALAIHEGVLTHIHIAQSSRYNNRTGCALETNSYPASAEKAMVIRVVRISADEVRSRPFPVETNDVRQGRFKQERFVRRTEVV